MRLSILLITILLAIHGINGFAQNFAGNSKTITMYEEFQPASIELHNGNVIKEKHANVFLKNGKLLYKSRNNTIMQANMSNIKSVCFADREYIRIDTLLAYVIDTIGCNRLLCATLIDIDSYKSQLTNSQLVTKFDLGGSFVNVTSLDDIPNKEEISYPLVNYFFFEINNKIIRVHERDICKVLPKNKQRIFKTMIDSPQFDFGNQECLKRILRELW